MIRFERSFRDDERGLEIIASRNHDQRFAVVEVSKELFRIVAGARDAEPQHVDGNARLNHLQPRNLPRNGVAAVASDYQAGVDINWTLRRIRPDSANLAAIVDQVNRLVLHLERERGEFLRSAGEKVEKIPLRHQRHKLAMRRHAPQAGPLEGIAPRRRR